MGTKTIMKVWCLLCLAIQSSRTGTGLVRQIKRSKLLRGTRGWPEYVLAEDLQKRVQEGIEAELSHSWQNQATAYIQSKQTNFSATITQLRSSSCATHDDYLGSIEKHVKSRGREYLIKQGRFWVGPAWNYAKRVTYSKRTSVIAGGPTPRP